MLKTLIKNFKLNEFSYDISNILKCSSTEELQTAFLFYSEFFQDVTDEEDIDLLNKLLTNIGLSFESETLLVTNDKRWKEVSLFERVSMQMPTTTNSLEAYHGQLYQYVPERNEFWNAFFKLSCNLMMKCNNIDEHIKHNYCHEKKKNDFTWFKNC